MKRWRCTVCGYIHTGDEVVGACPNCSAPREKFVPVAADFEEVHMPYGQKLSYGPEVDVNPFYGDYGVIAPFIYNLPKGKHVRLHRHPTNDELFFILKGRLKYRVADHEFVAVPGDTVKARMGVPHRFENIGDEPAAFLSVKAPKPVTIEFLEEEPEGAASTAAYKPAAPAEKPAPRPEPAPAPEPVPKPVPEPVPSEPPTPPLQPKVEYGR